MSSDVTDWSEVTPRTVIPGFVGRFVHSETMSFALWEIAAGAVLPEHTHPHEQVALVQEGEFEMTVEGVTRKVSAGMVSVIPGNARHHGRALTECRVLDVFYPVREDYRDGAGTTILGDAAGKS